MRSSERKHVKVTFEPEGRTVSVMKGTLLLEAAGRAGIVLDTPCGGQGTCGKCRIEVTENAPEPTEADQKHFSDEELARGFRLACQMRVVGDTTVLVPAATRFFEQRILTNGEGREVPLEPTVSKCHLNVAEPTLEDQRSDTDRILAEIGKKDLDPGLDMLKTLPSVMRASRFDITAVVAEDRVIAVEPGDTTGKNFGMAFDIGTTTVVGFLLDLVHGRELAVAARTNPQVKFGDDVVSRIQHSTSEKDGLKELQGVIVACLNDIIEDCCAQSGICCEHLYEATVVGNTTMNHLFLGISPEFVAQAPYVAALRRSVNVLGRDVGLHIHPYGIVHTLPNIAGFVGADTVGVILSSGMHEAKGNVLAIDIGTNGELVIGNRDRLVSCSTAAGPAFEGARIRNGMRASNGAIDKILINDDVEFNVIGDVPPRGLCGTAVIDLVAELVRVGCIDATGKLLPPGDMPATAGDAVKRRVKEAADGLEFVIAPEEETQLDGPLTLTQRDVRELQLAKGAIAAGVAILLKEFGLEPEDLHRVLLAGAFGNFIRRSMAKRIGLLPDIPTERISYIGNAAGAGARMALMSKRCKDEANLISEKTEYLELAGRPDFQMEFASAMLFGDV